MSENYFFAMLFRMRNINRWSLMRNTTEENLCEHSFDVAVIAHALAVIKNKRFGSSVNPERVAILALFHDTPEVLTGDLPTPVKYYNSEIRTAYAKIEENAQKKLLSMLPVFLQDEYEDLLTPNEGEKELWDIVKAADKISALIKCIQEKNMGNKEFNEAKKATETAIKDLHLPEADYFLRKFLPPYDLTVDEQQLI